MRKAVRVCHKNNNTTGTGTHAGTAFLIQNLGRREPSLFQNSLERNCTVNGTGLKFLLAVFEFCHLFSKFTIQLSWICYCNDKPPVDTMVLNLLQWLNLVPSPHCSWMRRTEVCIVEVYIVYKFDNSNNLLKVPCWSFLCEKRLSNTRNKRACWGCGIANFEIDMKL